MDAIKDLISEFNNMCGTNKTEMGDNATAKFAQLREEKDDLKVFCDSAGINLSYQAAELKTLRTALNETRTALRKALNLLDVDNLTRQKNYCELSEVLEKYSK